MDQFIRIFHAQMVTCNRFQVSIYLYIQLASKSWKGTKQIQILMERHGKLRLGGQLDPEMAFSGLIANDAVYSLYYRLALNCDIGWRLNSKDPSRHQQYA